MDAWILPHNSHVKLELHAVSPGSASYKVLAAWTLTAQHRWQGEAALGKRVLLDKDLPADIMIDITSAKSVQRNGMNLRCERQ